MRFTQELTLGKAFRQLHGRVGFLRFWTLSSQKTRRIIGARGCNFFLRKIDFFCRLFDNRFFWWWDKLNYFADEYLTMGFTNHTFLVIIYYFSSESVHEDNF